MIIAELRNVRKRFGPVAALDGFDLQIEQGQLLALLGRNGAGKTTATKLLLGLASADEGAARVFGHDPHQHAGRVRTGTMLQAGQVPETLRVAEHIQLFSSYYPKPLAAGEAIRAAGLEGLERRMFGSLSGGQRQRVLFALAICGRPDLLLLDEPTVGLDVDSRRGLWKHIRHFVAGGGSVLLTTHYLEEADALADHVTVIDKGRRVAEGSPAEIKRSICARRISCITELADDRLRSLEGVQSVTRAGGRVTLTAVDSDTVLHRLIAADPGVREVEIQGAGLEEAFLALTEVAQ
ncbi:ABC transporter ATP-binding protein [uncultured Paludibaculum sp.]|uniref:ABC transporter ATP-binding protein n=1 Tax=uncultured Paludibaculum sp. TaxID=1765020 RepID=UPI002AABA113|nr:ABC transporter ATP-binding protein [uncultured Paludibaculum sp.]